jgi:hypothetical protein
MIDPDFPIMWVKRVYLNDYEGDCFDFEVGELAMCVSESDHEDGMQGHCDLSWAACGVVQIVRDRVPQFESQNWDWGRPDHMCFWVMQEDCEPVDDDTDAKLRAYVALTGFAFVKEA